MRTNKLIPFILCGCFVSERPMIFSGYKSKTYWIWKESHTRNTFWFIFYGNTLNQEDKKLDEASFFIIPIKCNCENRDLEEALLFLYLMGKRFSWIPKIWSSLDACWRLYSFQGYFQYLYYVFLRFQQRAWVWNRNGRGSEIQYNYRHWTIIITQGDHVILV